MYMKFEFKFNLCNIFVKIRNGNTEYIKCESDIEIYQYVIEPTALKILIRMLHLALLWRHCSDTQQQHYNFNKNKIKSNQIIWFCLIESINRLYFNQVDMSCLPSLIFLFGIDINCFHNALDF